MKLSPPSKRAILRAAEAAAGGSASMSVTVVSPREIHLLNLRYRGKDKPTDVLSFPGIGGELGDVVLCLEIARKQAKEYGGTIEQELQRLTVHGVLHLRGYDHETNEADAKKMFTLQERILKRCHRPKGE